MAPQSLRVLTYKDSKWKLGADREYRFELMPENGSFVNAYRLLKDKLDQRFVAALVDKDIDEVWEIPVKLKGVLQGSEGTLKVGSDRIVYETDKKNASRTWRYQDIENLNSSGPFDLTLTTYERATTQFGNLKEFNFQLKGRLAEQRYNALWLRLNQEKGLNLLDSYRAAPTTDSSLSGTGNPTKEP